MGMHFGHRINGCHDKFAQFSYILRGEERIRGSKNYGVRMSVPLSGSLMHRPCSLDVFFLGTMGLN